MAWTATSYTVKGSSAGNEPMTPCDWQFQGSNDDSAWVLLDARTDQQFLAWEVKTYNIVNTTAYRYYRLLVSETWQHKYVDPGNHSQHIWDFRIYDDDTSAWVPDYMSSNVLPVPLTASQSTTVFAAWQAFDDPLNASIAGGNALPYWLKIDSGVDATFPASFTGQTQRNITDTASFTGQTQRTVYQIPDPSEPWLTVMDDSMNAATGRVILENGDVVNVADFIATGATVVIDSVEPGVPRTGRVLLDDNTVVNIADFLEGT